MDREQTFLTLELPEDEYRPEVLRKLAKRNYRRLAKRHHPDAGGDPEDFRKLSDAWESFCRNIPEGRSLPIKRSPFLLFRLWRDYIFETGSAKKVESLAVDSEEEFLLRKWTSNAVACGYLRIADLTNYYLPEDMTLYRFEVRVAILFGRHLDDREGFADLAARYALFRNM